MYLCNVFLMEIIQVYLTLSSKCGVASPTLTEYEKADTSIYRSETPNIKSGKPNIKILDVMFTVMICLVKGCCSGSCSLLTFCLLRGIENSAS